MRISKNARHPPDRPPGRPQFDPQNSTNITILLNNRDLIRKIAVFAGQIAGLSGGRPGGCRAFLEIRITHQPPSVGISEIHQV